MASNRKPTMMEMKQAVVNILGEISQIKQHLLGVDSALSGYIEYKEDSVEFSDWMKNKLEILNESRSTKPGDSSGTTGNRTTGKETSKKPNKKTKRKDPQTAKSSSASK